MDLTIRPRRLRACESLRRMVRETRVSPDSLVYPLFLIEGEKIKEPIESLDGQYRYSPDRVCEAIADCRAAGVSRVLLFGIPARKDACGSAAWDENGVVQQGIRAIKAAWPDCYVITDVCLCEYTDHGHCGILQGQNRGQRQDPGGACQDGGVPCPRQGRIWSRRRDMMDGRVAAIRAALDENGFVIDTHHGLLRQIRLRVLRPVPGGGRAPLRPSVTAGATRWIPTTARRPGRSAPWTPREGADILMVKPAMSYLDVIRECADAFDLPLAAYSVSGEYAMIKAAGAGGAGG